MGEVRRINDQLRRAFDGQAWHGPAVMEVLANVTARQAAAHPISDAHSIWEIVVHIGVWESVARRRVEGEDIKSVPPEEDWPPVNDIGEEAWQKALEELRQGHEALRQAISKLDDAQLSELAMGAEYAIYLVLHGVIQHDLYPAGQIALLKKAMG